MGLIVLALLGILGVLGAVCSKLLADEFKAWAPSIVAKIIAAAVRKLPPEMRERSSEEWQSHINDVPGDLSKTAVAFGFLIAAWDIAEGPFGLRKRALDLAFATSGLFFMGPVLILAGFAVAASSPGPILSRQTRIGRDGNPFKALKFRTMHRDAGDRLREYLTSNEAAKHEWADTGKLRYDPRVTSIGVILRKSGFEQLPQLFNVVAGHMSLVGPRALAEDDLRQQTKSMDTYAACKPGMTGHWRFGRHSKGAASYTSNWSLTLDLKIILATIPALLIIDEDSEHADDFEAGWKIGLLSIISIALAALGMAIFH